MVKPAGGVKKKARVLQAGEDGKRPRDPDPRLQIFGISSTPKAAISIVEEAGRLANPSSDSAFCAVHPTSRVFAWKHFSAVLAYAADRIPEIADDTS